MVDDALAYKLIVSEQYTGSKLPDGLRFATEADYDDG